MAARSTVPGLGPLESAIMTVLWNASRPLKPQEVRDQIDYHEVGYTTVASVLTILRDKEMTRRARQGRAYLYEAAVSRDQHLGRIVRAALDAADDPGLRPRPRLVHRLRSQSWLGRGLSPGVGSWNGREYLCGPASGSADPGFLRRASGLARSGRMSLAVGSGTLLDDLSVHNWAEESPAARIPLAPQHLQVALHGIAGSVGVRRHRNAARAQRRVLVSPRATARAQAAHRTAHGADHRAAQ